MQQENTRIITTLIFTFFALAFFGIFAIKPTITTIIELRKKLADNKLVSEQLNLKIQSLSALQSQYQELNSDLPIVFDAIPQSPHTTQLLSQVLGLARQKNVSVSSIETGQVVLFADQTQANIDQTAGQIGITQIETTQPEENNILPTEDNADNDTLTFTLKADGSYEDLLDFTQSLTKIQRIIKIDSLSINSSSNDGNLSINIDAKAYFKE